jgi:hypothetical protein
LAISFQAFYSLRLYQNYTRIVPRECSPDQTGGEVEPPVSDEPETTEMPQGEKKS